MGRFHPTHERHACSRSMGGFTLIELLLVVALLMLFAGAAVISLAPLGRSAPLEEGVGRLEGLLRFARAEAAHQGRRLRLHLSPGSALPLEPGTSAPPAVTVQWEPEPLRQPGVFVDNPATAALAQALVDLVRVEGVRRLDAEGSTAPAEGTTGSPDATAPVALMEGDAAAGPGGSGDLWPPITFYPDGSSDSAEILLAASDASESRRMLVRWNGVSGTAEHAESRPDSETGGDDQAQPLEPASVARSSMVPAAP